MSISYMLRESLSGFRRAKLSSALAVITIWIALLLLGLFAVASVNTQRFVQSLRGRLEMEAFLREPASDEELQRIEHAILGQDGVDSAVYVSKDEAAQRFQREFGEDIHRVLDFNPLPPSFKILPRASYRNSDSARVLHRKLTAIAGVDTVVYRRALLEVIDTRTAVVYRIALGLGLFVALSAVVLVGNTIRLSIDAKRHIIRTMELVGATRLFVRLPFLIEGMLQGLLGGILAGFLLNAAVEHLAILVSPELAAFIHMPTAFYASVAAAGTLLGLVGSTLSVMRFLRA
jgi:cell division transport system permease protein